MRSSATFAIPAALPAMALACSARPAISPIELPNSSVALATLRTFAEVCSHQVRWARTIRACRPVAFFFTVLSITAVWPLLWLAADPSLASALGAAICLGIFFGFDEVE